MERFGIATAQASMTKHAGGDLRHYYEVAEELKREFTAKYPGAWHVIVGKEFGSFVTHEARQ
jgi:hypothetical protein